VKNQMVGKHLAPDEYDRLVALMEKRRELKRLQKVLTEAPLEEELARLDKIAALTDQIDALVGKRWE
jgi:hypothetical protein